MPRSYTRSKRADQDIKQIIKRSMADFGELQTDKYIEGLEETLNMLAEHPDWGHTFTPEKTKRIYLRYRYMSHVVYYRQRKHDIFIVRILHTKMLPEKHL
jgi:toxin ParE1/3/4